jgi:hypothetical protein
MVRHRLWKSSQSPRPSRRRPEPVTVAGGRTAVGYRSEDRAAHRHIQGVRLRDGDRIVSPPLKGYDHTLLGADGLRRWCRRQLNRRGGIARALYSHIQTASARRTVANTLVPRLVGSDQTRTLSFEDGDRVHLTLVWDDGKSRRSTPRP